MEESTQNIEILKTNTIINLHKLMSSNKIRYFNSSKNEAVRTVVMNGDIEKDLKFIEQTLETKNNCEFGDDDI